MEMTMNVLIRAATHVEIVRYTSVATSMLVFWEYIITLNSEVRYLWKRRSTLAGVLLGLGRYVPILTSSHGLYLYTASKNISSCFPSYIVFVTLCYIEFLVPLFVLFLRAYAVWGGARPALISLSSIYLCCAGTITYLLYSYVHGVSVPTLRFSRGCLFLFANDDIWYALLMLVFCECVALGLLVAKLLQHMSYLKNRPKRPRQDLLTIVAHDGVGYFACSLAITTINLIVLRSLPTDLRDFLVATQGALQNILCNRLLFHVYSEHETRST